MKDSIWNDKPDKFRKECRKLLVLCQTIIDGEPELALAASRMCKYRFWMKEGKNSTWDIFTGISSETDHLPIGEERKNWNSEILEKKEKELRSIENHFRPHAIEAAKTIKSEYEKWVEPVVPYNSGQAPELRNLQGHINPNSNS